MVYNKQKFTKKKLYNQGSENILLIKFYEFANKKVFC